MTGAPVWETLDFPAPADWNMTVVHDSSAEERTFVHDTMMYVYGNKIYMAWYSCPRAEIADDTMIMGRCSSDGGKTWGETFVIAKDEGEAGEARHFVPVSFVEHEGVLYALISKMTQHDRPISVGLYRLADGEAQRWAYVGDVISEEDNISLILNNNALKMADGRYVISGRYHPAKNHYPDRPCVLFCEGKDITRWRIHPLPPAVEDACPETSVTITKEGHLVAVTRNAAGHPSVFYVSRDGGATWQWEINSMPTVASKLYLWTQKNGRTLLAFNAAADGRSRTRLCLASIDVETLCCQEIYTLAHGECQVGNVYHYPCVVEKDGRLYISCTVNSGTVRSAVVLDIPVFE